MRARFDTMSRAQLLELAYALDREIWQQGQIQRQLDAIIGPEVLTLGEGDLVVLTMPEGCDSVFAEALQRYWDDVMGPWLVARGIDVRLVVITDGAKLDVVHAH
jgi:hypothetical protein